jgi:hypothetical protein
MLVELSVEEREVEKWRNCGEIVCYIVEEEE